MRDFIVEFFSNYSRFIIFVHIISAVLIIGSLFLIRFLVAPVLDKIEQEDVRYNSYLTLIRRFFYIASILMIIVVVASVFMNVGLGFRYGDQTTYIMTHAKELVWTIMALNFIFMYFKYRNAQKALKANLMIEVHENIVIVVKYLIPVNLILSLVSVYIGFVIRGY